MIVCIVGEDTAVLNDAQHRRNCDIAIKSQNVYIY